MDSDVKRKRGRPPKKRPELEQKPKPEPGSMQCIRNLPSLSDYRGPRACPKPIRQERKREINGRPTER